MIRSGAQMKKWKAANSSEVEEKVGRRSAQTWDEISLSLRLVETLNAGRILESIGELSKMPILGSHPRPIISEPVKVGMNIGTFWSSSG